MKCFSLLLGARHTPKAGSRFTRTDEERLRAITFRHFSEGFTILNAEGGWFDPERKTFIKEESRQVIVCARSRRPLRAWCEELGRALGQTELLVVELGRSENYRIRLRR